MANSFFKFARNIFFALLVVLGISALGGAGWYYYGSQVQQPPPSSQKPSPSERPRAIAVIALDPSRQPAPMESPSGESVDRRRPVIILIEPAQDFSKETKSALKKEFASSYPQVWQLDREPPMIDAAYRDAAFQMMDAAEKASATQQPAMLLAADYLANGASCPDGQREECELARKQFADHHLNFEYGLEGRWLYDHSLLGRIWKDYPASDWGERAFVLLLSEGFDTSGTCSKGSDEFREVIRQGESFLEHRPGSPYRAVVMHLVGQAYATWWSLASTPSAGNEDFVDPKVYQEDSEQARLKAMEYFGKVLELSPDNQLGEYSRKVLPALRDKQMTTDSYHFYCVGD